ncbi:MAG: hypothetical protein ACTTIM_05245 [Campylobacter sp.]
MRKKIILLLICLNLVQAKVQNVELLADSVTRVGEIVNAMVTLSPIRRTIF